jgi:MscS family membrane protein
VDTEILDPKQWTWLISIAVGMGVAAVLSLVLRKIVAFVKKKAGNNQGLSEGKIHQITHLPLQIAIWGFGVAYAIDVVFTHFGLPGVEKYIRPLRTAFIAAALIWIALRWIRTAFEHWAKRSQRLGVAPGTIYAISKLVSFVASVLGFLIIFSIFGFNILPILTFGGIGVAGIAFAAQDFIANFFGGAMLHFTRTFSIGDKIVIPSKDNFDGVVKEIGWYITVVEDYYRRPVYFPNALFSKSHVINESRRSHRRIKGTITLRYEDLPNVESIVNELQDKIKAHPNIDETQSFSIQLSNYGNDGIDIFYYLLTREVRYLHFLELKQQVFLIMNEVVQKYGAQFCYPTHNVNLSQELPLQMKVPDPTMPIR